MDIINKYFPELTLEQKDQFQKLGTLYKTWNEKINVISRKDIENLYLRHVLHSLAVARFISINPGSEILDLGTGGGFPGVPLAILFPEVNFHLVDGTGKKIKVVKEISAALNLNNVKAEQQRVEEIKGKYYDFVLSRAVAELSVLLNWSHRLISRNEKNAIPNGLIALKGGNIEEEKKNLKSRSYCEIIPISNYFSESFFENKFVVYVQV